MQKKLRTVNSTQKESRTAVNEILLYVLRNPDWFIFVDVDSFEVGYSISLTGSLNFLQQVNINNYVQRTVQINCCLMSISDFIAIYALHHNSSNIELRSKSHIKCHVWSGQ